MSHLRRLSTRSLIAITAAAVIVAAGGAAIAVAARGGGPTPPPKPLDQAVHDALGANRPAGVTARVRFTNRLFPSGSLIGQLGSALMSGASGRLWLTDDGRGRVELQSDAGDVQIVWNDQRISVYDASSNTVYRVTLPKQTGNGSTGDKGTPPTLAQIDKVLADIGVHWALSGARATDVAGRPAYSVSSSPGTPSTARPCGPGSTHRAAARPCCSSRSRTSPTARSPTVTSTSLRRPAPR
jgi:hypothetical protein